ncbi:hypothetical protein M8845_15310 [Gelidibacter japonicus]|uniref:hypothetical protein n=1 Tax=Gelidibacter japonicus TaxID=1962232 RepID=UPI002021A033|nr:hypothetical protein [Gelidibacter japonicus]MCL8008797.1 hypothetical protein [Gelidibacter japonicus]
MPSPPTPYVSISYMYPTGGGQNQGNCEVGCENNWNFGGGGIYGGDVVEIINNLTGKANCTYLKLENNSILQKTIERFKGKTPINLIINQESNLTIRDQNGKNVLVNAITSYGNSYNINITLNTEQANNRPSLALVRTILHEAIHAEIYRKVKTTSGVSLVNGEWQLPDGSRANFPSLFDAYNEDPSNPYHNYMAKYYREALELGMKEYATSIGETHSDEFYKDLAWNGLLNTKAWENRYADSLYAKKEKTRIITVIANYEKSKKNECQ